MEQQKFHITDDYFICCLAAHRRIDALVGIRRIAHFYSAKFPFQGSHFIHRNLEKDHSFPCPIHSCISINCCYIQTMWSLWWCQTSRRITDWRSAFCPARSILSLKNPNTHTPKNHMRMITTMNLCVCRIQKEIMNVSPALIISVRLRFIRNDWPISNLYFW